MIQLPPLPSWDGLHPLIVHFPIALLLVAPIFLVLGALLSPPKGKSFLAAALLIMLLGTMSTFVAVETGEAAAQLAERTDQGNLVLKQHQELAETTRVVFAALTLLFGAIIYGARLWQRVPTRLSTTVLPMLFLVLYGAGAVILINTAHNGGRLVHELGVTSMVSPAVNPPTTSGEGD